MVFDIIFGAVIAVPMLVGMLGYPWAVWKWLDQRYLNKRGVGLWKQIVAVLIAIVPAVITLSIFGVLTEFLEIGPSSAEWQRARESHPRGIPPQAIPMAIGMLGGIVFLSRYYEKLFRYLPLLNKVESAKESTLDSPRTQKGELHPLEWYAKSMFLDDRNSYIGALELADIPAFVGSPQHVKERFYRQFLDAELLLIVKRNVEAENLRKGDLKYGLNTVIVAEDDDCLRAFRSLARAPVVKITGRRLLDYLQDNASVVVKQPEMQIMLVPEDIALMQEMVQQTNQS